MQERNFKTITEDPVAEDQNAPDTLEDGIYHINHLIKEHTDLTGYDFNRNKKQEVVLPSRDPS